MDTNPLLSSLARLRTAAARFCEYSRAEAYALAEKGDNAASLKIDGEADQLDNLTYDITDLIDRLAEVSQVEGLADIEQEAASFPPEKDFRTCFADLAGELETEMQELSAAGEEYTGLCDDLDGLIFMIRAISRRK